MLESLRSFRNLGKLKMIAEIDNSYLKGYIFSYPGTLTALLGGFLQTDTLARNSLHHGEGVFYANLPLPIFTRASSQPPRACCPDRPRSCLRACKLPLEMPSKKGARGGEIVTHALFREGSYIGSI